MRIFIALVVCACTLLASCGALSIDLVGRPVESRLAFTNFSGSLYAALAVRAHDESETGEFAQLPLLAPGATVRAAFLETLGEPCPQSLDLQLRLYARVDNDVPIGLDEAEQVQPTPVVAGEVFDVPACSVQVVETYTIVNWDVAQEGVARVKIAQDTDVEAFIINNDVFDGPDGTWQVTGVAPELAEEPAPPLADAQTIAGRVTLADGSGVDGVGVLIRPRFRVRLNDSDQTNDPDAGFGDPIALTETDGGGAFSFGRPAGAYEVEVFSDDFAFRPSSVIVESPIEVISIVAEPVDNDEP